MILIKKQKRYKKKLFKKIRIKEKYITFAAEMFET